MLIHPITTHGSYCHTHPEANRSVAWRWVGSSRINAADLEEGWLRNIKNAAGGKLTRVLLALGDNRIQVYIVSPRSKLATITLQGDTEPKELRHLAKAVVRSIQLYQKANQITKRNNENKKAG